jgi:hypothetical protein
VLRAVNTGTPCVGVYANHGPGAKPTGPFSSQTLARGWPREQANALIDSFGPEIPLLVTTQTVLAAESWRMRLCRMLFRAEPSGPLSYLYLVARTT